MTLRERFGPDLVEILEHKFGRGRSLGALPVEVVNSATLGIDLNHILCACKLLEPRLSIAFG